MKIIIPGGSGQVGRMLARTFHRDGHYVVILSRAPQRSPWKVVAWDPYGANLTSKTEWVREIDGADVIVNLAGKSVNCRYHRRNRVEIMKSRIASVHAVERAIQLVQRPPQVWLQAGTATIYAHTFDQLQDEFTGVIGGYESNVPDTWKFSIDVATTWEKTFETADIPGMRKVVLRSAMTMSPDPGGVFNTLLKLTQFGLGGKIGDGRQFMSWIHEFDFVRAIYWLIEHQQFTGAVNLSSPCPLTQGDFMRELRQAWGIRVGLPATRWMLEIGCLLMRTESELILKSRRVVPSRLLQEGFTFEYPHWRNAAAELCCRWRTNR
ncbi:MAG: TIGR01777 family oxidoreductase [Planctomycetota bacterium]|nr:TIGR01777 family oxidoreductase [Planctomycetota bacterium]MDA1212318.1 TIGR01777 family oxidoreductase [Planctomycetota bacterium]